MAHQDPTQEERKARTSRKERTPAQNAALLGLVMLVAIFATLVVFLVITWLTGDTTNDLKQHQPEPSPAATS